MINSGFGPYIKDADADFRRGRTACRADAAAPLLADATIVSRIVKLHYAIFVRSRDQISA